MAATTLFAGDVHGQFSNDNQHLILFITSGLKRYIYMISTWPVRISAFRNAGLFGTGTGTGGAHRCQEPVWVGVT